MQSINYNINQRLESALIQLRQQKHKAGFIVVFIFHLGLNLWLIIS